MEREALRHAKEQACEEARQQVLQAQIDREFRKSQEAAERQIRFEERGGWWAVVYWVVIVLLSIPFMGIIPLLPALAWHFWKKRR
jgi:uncharacterized membrane protein